MASHKSQMDIPTICFGFTLGFMVLTGSKVGKQTLSVYKRTHSLWSIYILMIWAEMVVCLAWAISAWIFLRGDIEGGFWFFFYIAALWTIQTQCLIQIIANRVALVMTSRSRARVLKLSLLVAVGLINISVFVVWIPARLEVSHTFVHLNMIWDRIEKVLYLVIDFGLNCYFLYLVRSKLIARGLAKYKPLFRFNACIVVISIAMDILIIGMMSLPNDLVYMQFHSLAYIVKLNIELTMADLISKVVRRQDRTDKPHSSSSPSKGTELSKTRTNNPTISTHAGTVFQLSTQAKGADFTSTGRQADGDVSGAIGGSDAVSDSSSDSGLNFCVPESGIMKTVAVETVIEAGRGEGAVNDEERASTTSSTVRLNKHVGMEYGRGA